MDFGVLWWVYRVVGVSRLEVGKVVVEGCTEPDVHCRAPN